MARFRSDIVDGFVDVMPLVAAAVPFGLIYGQQALDKGLSPIEILAMSVIVFAGSAQILAISLWQHPIPVAALALAALLINLRHVLMGASLSAKFAAFGRWRWLAAFLMTDEAWVSSERRSLSGSLSRAYYFSAALTLFCFWQAASLGGTILGRLIPHPEAWGLDFAFPVIFMAMALGFWKGLGRTGPVIAASGLVAVIVHQVTPGAWYVIAGALAGIAAAVTSDVLLPSPAEDRP